MLKLVNKMSNDHWDNVLLTIQRHKYATTNKI